jgi:hypothetical protein
MDTLRRSSFPGVLQLLRLARCAEVELLPEAVICFKANLFSNIGSSM